MSELLRILLPAVEAAAGRRLRPRDLDTIVLHNTGAIPPLRITGNGIAGEPGFNAVLAERGRPIYFCKCRPAGDPALTHEGAIGEILMRHPAMAAHVAPTRLERGDVMDVLVVQRLLGRPYHEVLVKEGDTMWPTSVDRVVGLVEQMAAHVGAALPALRGPATLRLAEEGRWALDALADRGLAAQRVKSLAMALERGGQVAAELQHGDLWPPNVLVNGTSWYVLDLELFGRIRVPLYDLLHMLHICSEVRHTRTSSRQQWIERVVRNDPTESRALDLVRRTAHRHQLAASSTFAALVYYAVDMAARVKARGAWTADWRQYLFQVERLADLIADGVGEATFTLRSAEDGPDR